MSNSYRLPEDPLALDWSDSQTLFYNRNSGHNQLCLERKLVRTDPTWGIRLKLSKSDRHHTWSEDEIAQFEQVAAHFEVRVILLNFVAQERNAVPGAREPFPSH